jgi:tRNA(Ile)-lysidine synthase TilS/MesJ
VIDEVSDVTTVCFAIAQEQAQIACRQLDELEAVVASVAEGIQAYADALQAACDEIVKQAGDGAEYVIERLSGAEKSMESAEATARDWVAQHTRHAAQ